MWIGPSFYSFVILCFGFALTPGPNMMYTLSRSISQGRRAGLVSVAGIGLAGLFYAFSAALGITALLLTVPMAYDTLRFAGALYLLYLAWQTLKPGSRSPFEVRDLPPASSKRLFLMGFLTNLLNPKAAVLYLSLLPQFIDPALGHVLGQSVLLGMTQMTMSIVVNSTVALAAGSLAAFFSRSPRWLAAQRWLMGSVLAAMALRMATARR